MTVADDRLREILAGCEGATPTLRSDLMEYEHGGGRLAIIRDGRRQLIADFYGDGADRDHYANCDPQTVSGIVSELLELRVEVAAAKAFGGGFYDGLVIEATRNHYRALAAESKEPS